MSFGQHGPGQGLSQRTVAEAAQISRAAYGRIERAEAASLPISVAFRVSAVLGLDLSVRLYPGPEPIRDAGQASRLGRLVASVGLPLRYRTDVPLPSPPLGPPEQGAWDLEIRGHGSARRSSSRLGSLTYRRRRSAVTEPSGGTIRLITSCSCWPTPGTTARCCVITARYWLTCPDSGRRRCPGRCEPGAIHRPA
jgi:transcriptional regulator with XRE-family HTH domain